MRSSIRFQRPLERKQRVYTQAKDYQYQRTISGHISPVHRSEIELNRKFRLVPIEQRSQKLKINQQKERDKVYFQSKDNYILRDDVHQLKKGIHQLRQELRLIKNKGEQSSSINLIKPSLFYRQEDQIKNSRGRKYFYPHWKNQQPFDIQSQRSNKLITPSSRLRLKALNNDDEQSRQVLPVIYRIKRSPYKKQSRKQYLQSSYRQYDSLFKSAPKRRYLQNFRKIGHVILFTIYLRTFNERMRQQRKTLFDKNIKESLNQKLLQLKKYMIQGSQLFFNAIIDQYKFDYRPTAQDDAKLQKQKIKSLKRLTGIQVDCIHSCIRQMSKRDYLTQTLYFLCKHGTFSCLYPINSQQQMSIMCISEVHGYMRGDKCLEQSSILSLVFVKLLLYNILLKPQTVDFRINQKVNKAIIYSNIKIVANLIYQMLMEIQDDLLEQSPQVYTIGNWQKLKHRFNFQVAQSMTVKPGFIQKNELISGFADHKTIRDFYGTKSMFEQKSILTTSLKYLHHNIISYHQKIRKKCFQK